MRGAVAEEFRYTIRVRYNECDPQGHVFNANYLGYFDLAMTELWRDLGGYVEMRETGVDMVVAQAGIHYYAALGFDDEADLIVRPGPARQHLDDQHAGDRARRRDRRRGRAAPRVRGPRQGRDARRSRTGSARALVSYS